MEISMASRWTARVRVSRFESSYGPLMEHTINITQDDLRPPPRRARRSPLGVRPGQLPQAMFVAEVTGQGLAHVARDSFRGNATPERLAELATPILVRANAQADEVE